jgi:pimeloyl-ACP methyl ester carboxylesterase
LVSGPGRRLGDVLRAQLEANPANAQILPQALEAISTLEAGGPVDASTLHPALAPLFATALQPFLRNLFRRDPAAMISGLDLPILILQGETDIQTGAEDARRLAEANPKAELRLLPGVNHVLKMAPAGDPAANLATYSDPDLPLAPGVVDTVADFVRGTARH